jgi:hypothetical protein
LPVQVCHEILFADAYAPAWLIRRERSGSYCSPDGIDRNAEIFGDLSGREHAGHGRGACHRRVYDDHIANTMK